jgi:TolB-like protein/tetratricopeptide (TPR) repeat protein
MVADFVASTSEMETDEDVAVTRIAACLDAVSAVILRHQRRVFNTPGDAILSEFSSPINALHAALDARAALVGIAGSTPQDMRFGIHLADVIVVGTDLRGDGVNLAARLQASAEPGEIIVSEALVQQVQRNSPCGFVDLGERPLKGLSKPVRSFRAGTPAVKHVNDLRKAMPTALPARRPNSVAVQPFEAMSDDEDQTFLADGLTEDLILELGRFSGLFVASRSASASLTGQNAQKIGEQLGVRFLLTGSVRKWRDRIRLNITLVDTQDGRSVWSDRIDRSFDEVMDRLDEITARIAATIVGRLEQAEIAATRLKRPEMMSAYEHYLRGVEFHRLAGISDGNAREAMVWFDRAINADPNFGRAYALKCCSWAWLPDLDMQAAEQLVSKATRLDPLDAQARRVMGSIRLMRGDYEEAGLHYAKALELAPHDAYIVGLSASFHTFNGEPGRALALLERAEALDPFLPVYVVEERIAALYVLGQHDDMRRAAYALPYQTRRSRLYRAAARMAEGETDRAERLIREARLDDPGLSADYVRAQEMFRDRKIADSLIARLVAAGLPAQRPPDDLARSFTPAVKTNGQFPNNSRPTH